MITKVFLNMCIKSNGLEIVKLEYNIDAMDSCHAILLVRSW